MRHAHANITRRYFFSLLFHSFFISHGKCPKTDIAVNSEQMGHKASCCCLDYCIIPQSVGQEGGVEGVFTFGIPASPELQVTLQFHPKKQGHTLREMGVEMMLSLHYGFFFPYQRTSSSSAFPLKCLQPGSSVRYCTTGYSSGCYTVHQL